MLLQFIIIWAYKIICANNTQLVRKWGFLYMMMIVVVLFSTILLLS
jgi:hypothetical protein